MVRKVQFNLLQESARLEPVEARAYLPNSQTKETDSPASPIAASIRDQIQYEAADTQRIKKVNTTIYAKKSVSTDKMCVMVRKFPAGAFSFEIDNEEIRLIYSNKVIDKRVLPLVLDELPLSGRATPLAKWSSAWCHLLAFDPEAAEELRVLAANENPPPGSAD